MILVRQVFQVKYNQMDKLLAAIKKYAESGTTASNVTRVLTDISGPNFTLVFESKAESMDAYWEALQASFASPEMADMADIFTDNIRSGYREFYTIEYEAES